MITLTFLTTLFEFELCTAAEPKMHVSQDDMEKERK